MALRRSLGLAALLFYGVGTIVGAGIYTVLGAAAESAGAATWVALGLASIAAFLTALSYAELVAAFPRAGAEYQYLKQAFPRWRILAVIAGLLIALNASATSAAVALAFGGYLRVFVEVPAWAVALALLVACTGVNIAGIRQSTAFSIALVCVEVGGLLLLIGAGFATGDVTRAVSLPSLDQGGAILAATALLFFVYIGFEDIANLAEEARQPRRDVPRALLASVVITSAVYLLVAFAAFAVTTPEELAGSESPLTEAGRAVAPWLGTTLAVTALFATASTALIALVSISRMLFAMGRDGDMPAALAKLLPGRKTPWIAGLVLFAGALALLPLGQVKTVASVSAFGILVVFIGVQAAAIALRFRKPALERPFRMVSVGRWPLPPVFGIGLCLVLVTQFEPVVYAIGLGVIAAGAALYAFGTMIGFRKGAARSR